MNIVGEFDYRNAKAIIARSHSAERDECLAILADPSTQVNLSSKGLRRDLSAQLAMYFASRGWLREQPVFSLPDLRYDLIKHGLPIEIEIGHQRLVYADFFKFLADYAQQKIPAGVMLVTGDARRFGHNWHNSLISTRKKLEAVASALLVPIFVVVVDP